MSFKLKVTLHAMAAICKTFIVVEYPEFGLSIIGASCKESVLERRPLHIEDIAGVSLDQGCIGIEGECTFSIEYGDCRGLVPRNGDHLAV